MKRIFLFFSVFTIFFGLTLSSHAVLLLFDDFNSEHGSAGNLTVFNYTGFANWTISNGTVDLIGPGFQGLCTSSCVDLDGTSNPGDAGIMTSNISFLDAGVYTLEFDLEGNHRSFPDDTVVVSLGTALNTSFTLSSSDPFQHIVLTFSISGNGGNLTFENLGGDRVGVLLDNVSLDGVLNADGGNGASVPEPSTLLLFGSGLAGLGLWGRKRLVK